ncbi:hypothetical protein LCGC14_0740270 [marine sediment metagenome]|uniref:Uncharacterized protein n=1 Tax=marine sediment metagenome TaxID=412755 RepID=A0A0F9TE28_9ZZZZ
MSGTSGGIEPRSLEYQMQVIRDHAHGSIRLNDIGRLVFETQLLKACYNNITNVVSKDGFKFFSILDRDGRSEVLLELEGTKLSSSWERQDEFRRIRRNPRRR